MYQRGLKIREAKLGTSNEKVAETWDDLASLYTKTGEAKKAEAAQAQAKVIREAKAPAANTNKPPVPPAPSK